MKTHVDNKMANQMEDGMSEVEALRDGAESNLDEKEESVDEVQENCDGRNHFNLKKFSIRLEKLTFIENALKSDCQSVLLTNVSH